MKIKTLILIIAFLGLASICLGQEDYLILGKEFKSPERPRVIFHHDLHNEKAHIENCSVCHHVYKNGKLVPDESSEDQPCSSCHKVHPVKGDNPISLREAYHKRCMGCHLKEKRGPVMCGECHKANNEKKSK
ncbi:MAG: cytochrome c3 family protein [Desulfonauticus sp.]|nr:cytochrome c3 family protein [Desulfonauticus sp.]